MKILAVDIGGTMIKTGVLNSHGERIQLGSFPMNKDYSTVIDRLISHIDNDYPKDFSGIAISTTGLVDPVTQQIGMDSPLYEGFGNRMVSFLTDYYQKPVIAENDGNCALLAEKWLGRGRGASSFAVIVLGTSVGGGLMVDNQLIRGKHFLAGEFGYMLFPEVEKKDWEIWSIAGATRTLVEQVAAEKKAPSIDGYKVVAYYQQNDPAVTIWVDRFIEKLAVACYNLQYILDPEIVLIGGGISESDFLLPLLEKKIQQIAAQIPSTVRLPNVACCQFGNESNLIGACYNWLLQTFEMKTS
ncbi:sugar kinase [Enterococcus gallinarum]|uniref:ROK family protein n=1 Tax=Enterococcus gallinarum TaxID=1353 RepID=UPI0009C140BC|nr:ROK family protein [Enterococcus gallinarum]OQO79455.1 sugar kinase [Enterococcus gallinarum]